jgi:hypothetical protein
MLAFDPISVINSRSANQWGEPADAAATTESRGRLTNVTGFIQPTRCQVQASRRICQVFFAKAASETLSSNGPFFCSALLRLLSLVSCPLHIIITYDEVKTTQLRTQPPSISVPLSARYRDLGRIALNPPPGCLNTAEADL